MKTIESILPEAVNEATQTFKVDYHAMGYMHTGGSYQNIRAEGNEIKAPISVFTLIWGRRPGTYAPWGYKRGTTEPTDLMQWCMGVLAKTEKEARSTSFLVSRKLKEQGNNVYRGLKPPVPTSGTIEKASEKMHELVAKSFLETIAKVTQNKISEQCITLRF